MKPLIIASIAIFTATAATAQTAGDYAHNAASKSKRSETRKEAREERKALRKLEGADVSYFSKQQFAADFNNPADVSWKRTSYFDEATFTQNGHTLTAYYDLHSQLVGTTEEKSYSDLPAAAQKEIAKRYKGYEVEKVIMFDDNDANDTDMLLYGVQFEDADNYFVEMQKGDKKLILQVSLEGDVYYFTTMNK